MLGYNHAIPGGESQRNGQKQKRKAARCADSRKCFLTGEIADNNCIDCIVKLL